MTLIMNLNSGNDNKFTNLSNVIEEQINDLSISNLGLDTSDANDLDETVESFIHGEANLKGNNDIRTSFNAEKDANRVIDILNDNEVRWMYKNNVNKRWIEFSGFDNLQLEKSFRVLFGGLFGLNKDNTVVNGSYLTIETPGKSDNLAPPSPSSTTSGGSRRESDLTKILVRGGLYEVDLLTNLCTSIYWPGEEFTVIRGTWFYEATWQPLEDEQAKRLEDIHISLFKGKKSADYVIESHSKGIPTDALHSEAFSSFNVDWYSPNEIYLYSQDTPSKIVRSFTQRLGYFQKSAGSRIMRGYKYLATDGDKMTDIEHLVFVVHGIGQKMNIGAQIFRNTSLIREQATSLKEKYFPDFKKRLEFFPVEWRSNLTLDGGCVDSITPLRINIVRQLLNSSAMDIMYYTSPIYCSEIQEGLVTEMNRLYSMFIERNPTIRPKVSVIAHSLGAVIAYDITTGWVPMGCANGESFIPGKSRLNFELDNFFCIGSPLSVFLAMRVPKGLQGYHLFPPSLCNRLYNIFHLTDPVAYRLEPLIVRDYAKIAPIAIQSFSSPNPIAYSEFPLEPLDTETMAAMTRSETSENTTSAATTSTVITSPTETQKEKGWRLWSLVRGGNKNSLEGTNSPQHQESPVQSLEHRLDYVLTSGAAGPLVIRSVLMSHTSYWSNPDVAFFVLTRIFPELETRLIEGIAATSDATDNTAASVVNSNGNILSPTTNTILQLPTSKLLSASK